MNKYQGRMVATLSKQLDYEMQNAETIFMNYMENPCAIGEHPSLPEEAMKALKDYESASSRMEALNVMAKLMEND